MKTDGVCWSTVNQTSNLSQYLLCPLFITHYYSRFESSFDLSSSNLFMIFTFIFSSVCFCCCCFFCLSISMFLIYNFFFCFLLKFCFNISQTLNRQLLNLVFYKSHSFTNFNTFFFYSLYFYVTK